MFPRDAELAFREALLLQESGQLEEAAAVYEELLAGRDDRCFQSVDADLRGWKARHNLALVYEALGKQQQAARQRQHLREHRREQQTVERGGTTRQTL